MGADEKKRTEELETAKANTQNQGLPKRNSKIKKSNVDSVMNAAIQKIEPSKESTLAISNMVYKKDASSVIECLFINKMYRFVKAKQNINQHNIAELDDYMAQLLKHFPEAVREQILKEYNGKDSVENKVSYAHDFVEKLEASIKSNNEELYKSIIRARNYRDFNDLYVVAGSVFNLNNTPTWNSDKSQYEILSYEKIFGNAVEKMKDVNAFNLLEKLELVGELHSFLDGQILSKSVRKSDNEVSAVVLGETGETLLLESLKSLRHSIENQKEFSKEERDLATDFYFDLENLESEILSKLNNQNSQKINLIKQEISAIKKSQFLANASPLHADLQMAQAIKNITPSKESTPTISDMSYKDDPTSIECLFINKMYRFVKAKQNVDNHNVAELDNYMNQVLKHFPKEMAEEILNEYHRKNAISDKVSFAHDFMENLELTIQNNNQALYDKIIVSRNYQDVVSAAGYLGVASVFDLNATPIWNPEANRHEELSYEKVFNQSINKVKDVNAFDLLGKIELIGIMQNFMHNEIFPNDGFREPTKVSGFILGEAGTTLLLESFKSLRHNLEEQKIFSEEERASAIELYFDLDKLEKEILPKLNNQNSQSVNLIKQEIVAIKKSQFLASVSLQVQVRQQAAATSIDSAVNPAIIAAAKAVAANLKKQNIGASSSMSTAPLLPSQRTNSETLATLDKPKKEPTLVKPENAVPDIGKNESIAKLKEKIVANSDKALKAHENKIKTIQNKQVNYFDITDNVTNKHVAEASFTNDNVAYHLAADCKNEKIILSLLKTLKEPVQISNPNDLEHAVEIFSIAKKHNVKALLDDQTKALCIKEGSPVKEKYLALAAEIGKPKIKP